MLTLRTGKQKKQIVHIFESFHSMLMNSIFSSNKFHFTYGKARLFAIFVVTIFSVTPILNSYALMQQYIPGLDNLKEKQTKTLKKRKELEDKIKEQQTQLQQKGEEKIDLGEKISQLESEIDELTRTLKNMDNENKKLENEITKLDELDKKNIECVKLVLEKAYTGNETEDIDILLAINNSDEETVEKKVVVGSVKSFVKSKEAEHAKIREKTEAHRNEIKEKIRVKRLSEQSLESKKSDLSRLYSEKKDEIADLTSENDQTQEELKKAEQEYQKQEEEIQRVYREFQRRMEEEKKRRKEERKRREEEKRRQEEEKKQRASHALSILNRAKIVKDNPITPSITAESGTYKWPCPGYSLITTEFGVKSSVHRRPHNGIDISGNGICGTPVIAPHSGVILVAANTGNGYGIHVCIGHENGYMTILGHFDSLAKNITVGKNVNQGEIVGYVGSTGFSTGPHLHWELRNKFGQPIDPRTY